MLRKENNLFTGIVTGVGHVTQKREHASGARFVIDASVLDAEAISEGASISVSGVCLTVVEPRGKIFAADVSSETLDRTTLGDVRIGAPLNLEPALRLSSAMGGHWVSGHVDGVGQVRQIESSAEGGWDISVQSPEELNRFLAIKGSVAVDGVSLTINRADHRGFSVMLIPATRERTTLGSLKVGDHVNLEVDVIARYLDRLLDARSLGANVRK